MKVVGREFPLTTKVAATVEVRAHAEKLSSPLLRRCLLAALSGSALGLALGVLAFWLSSLVLAGVALMGAGVASLFPSADPVYTRAALATLGNVRLQGLILAGPPGDFLHRMLPRVFLDPVAAQGVVLRAGIAPGSPLLGRILATDIAQTLVLVVGLALVLAGVRRGRVATLIAGFAVQAQVALSVIGAPPTLTDLESIGLSFAINMFVPSVSNHRSLVLSDLVAGVPPALVTGGLVALALVAAYLGAVGLMLLWSGVLLLLRPLSKRHWRLRHNVMARPRGYSAVLPGLLVVSLVLGSAGIAGASLGFDSSGTLDANPVHSRTAAQRPAAGVVPGPPPALMGPSVSPTPGGAPAATVAQGDRWYADAPPPARPHRVEIGHSADGSYQYLVDGRPEVIHGMGLNTQYALLLSPSDRAAQLDADFTQMQAMGINTVLGWDPAEFDDPLLDLAEKHGLGVVLPFDLDPDADYTDPGVRAAMTEQVRAWVMRYRSHPGLRMWGLGNEVLHKIVHPSWLGPESPEHIRMAKAFSTFLVQTADLIHSLDPNHPVTYRDAEDAFATWVTDALNATPADRSSWFVYGTNCYTDRLKTILDNWPKQKMGAALWVSEFAPGGLAIPDRPEGFHTMWTYVRGDQDWVLGGAVYAWTRNGPEEIDHNLGLTDDGAFVDGRSLDEISDLWTNPETPPDPAAGS